MLTNASISLLLLLTTAQTVVAQNQSNYIQLDIDNASYSGNVNSQMKFRQMSLSWNGLNVEITNNDEIFNSNIVRRNKFFGLIGDNLNVGFQLQSTAVIDIIKDLELSSSNLLLNPLFLSFSGEDFNAKGENLNFSIKNYNLYCQGSETVDMTSLDGITKGCLNASFLNTSEKSGSETIKLETGQKSAESAIYISSNINELQLGEESLEVVTSKNTIDIPGFIIETNVANLKCAKSFLNADNLDFDSIFKTCNNDFSADTPKIILKDKEEETRFFGRVNKGVAANERIQFILPEGQIADKKSATSLLNINLACYKDPENSIFDLQGIIGDCISLGSIKTSHIITNEDKGRTYKLYERLMEVNVNPIAGFSTANASVKDFHAYFKDNKVTITAQVKVPVLGFQNISFNADVTHNKDKKIIILGVNSAKLPLGISSVNFLMKQLKKHLVNSVVSVEGNKIIVQL